MWKIFQEVTKIKLDEFSNYSSDWFTKRFVQTYHIKVKIGKTNAFRLFLTEFKDYFHNKLNNISFVWMKTVSGGDAEEYHLFIALNQIEDFAQLEDIFEMSSDEKNMSSNYSNSVSLNVSELWIYSEKLSLIIEEK